MEGDSYSIKSRVWIEVGLEVGVEVGVEVGLGYPRWHSRESEGAPTNTLSGPRSRRGVSHPPPR